MTFGEIFLERMIQMMMINLTPHTVNIVREDGSILSIAPSGKVARCEQREEQMPVLADGIPVMRLVLGAVVDLPPAQEGVIYLVSHIVMQACPERKDLAKPGQLVRNEAGEIIGCRCLNVL